MVPSFNNLISLSTPGLPGATTERMQHYKPVLSSSEVWLQASKVQQDNGSKTLLGGISSFRERDREKRPPKKVSLS